MWAGLGTRVRSQVSTIAPRSEGSHEPQPTSRKARQMNIFLTANMKTFDEFAALYSEDTGSAGTGSALLYALETAKRKSDTRSSTSYLSAIHRSPTESGDGASLLHPAGSLNHDPNRDAAIAGPGHYREDRCLDNRAPPSVPSPHLLRRGPHTHLRRRLRVPDLSDRR